MNRYQQTNTYTNEQLFGPGSCLAASRLACSGFTWPGNEFLSTWAALDRIVCPSARLGFG